MLKNEIYEKLDQFLEGKPKFPQEKLTKFLDYLDYSDNLIKASQSKLISFKDVKIGDYFYHKASKELFSVSKKTPMGNSGLHQLVALGGKHRGVYEISHPDTNKFYEHVPKNKVSSKLFFKSYKNEKFRDRLENLIKAGKMKPIKFKNINVGDILHHKPTNTRYEITKKEEEHPDLQGKQFGRHYEVKVISTSKKTKDDHPAKRNADLYNKKSLHLLHHLDVESNSNNWVHVPSVSFKKNLSEIGPSKVNHVPPYKKNDHFQGPTGREYLYDKSVEDQHILYPISQTGTWDTLDSITISLDKLREYKLLGSVDIERKRELDKQKDTKWVNPC